MLGDAFALASAACFGVANVTISKGSVRGADDTGVFLSLILTSLIAGLGWIVTGVLHGFITFSVTGLAWFAGAGVFSSFVGRVFLYTSIQHLGATRASTIKRLNPFFSVILGVLVLNESITGGMTLGMLLILASFLILAKNAFASRTTVNAEERHKHWFTRLFNLGYVYGPISALGYAVGYLFRKQGLDAIPDPFLGTMVGSLVGVAMFLFLGLFRSNYSGAIRSTFTTYNKWLFAAGMMTSIGQILYFVALNNSTVSRVAMIVSMEVFITMFLAMLVSRGKEKLTLAVFIAATLGVVGTVCIVAL